jgi:hypothetical protein
VNTHPPNTELEEKKKRRGTLLVGRSVIREITKYTFDYDTDPICIGGRGGSREGGAPPKIVKN